MWNTLCTIIGTPMGWIYNLVENYGLSILLFTVLLKIVLFPISYKQHKSSLAMVRLRPYQDELMKKYGSNRQRYSEELQKLYQREGYNPMSSCLPMLLQMPLLFMMYTVIRRPLTFMAGWSLTEIWETATAKIGVVVKDGVTMLDNMGKLQITAENFNRYESQILSHLGEKAPLNTTFLGLDMSLVPNEVWKTSFFIVIIPILSGVTSFLLSWLSQKMNPAQQAAADGPGGNNKTMLYLMPLMSLWIAFTFPAGLGLYWLASNVLGIGQLYVLNALQNPKKIEAEMRAKIEADKAKEKEKRAAAAAKKAQYAKGKKKKKGSRPQPKANGEQNND